MKMIILFGPQGSGNHLFGKIFSLHEQVHGWKDALQPDGYFIPHYKEPFNWHWNHIDEMTLENTMCGKQYAVTSISNPYIEKFVPKIPPIMDMTEKLESLGIEVQHVVIGRDKNILTHQQTRLRGGPTWGNMLQLLRWSKAPPFFISQELLYLYRREYVKSLGHWLDFPMAHEDPRIDEILKDDANEKYIHPADPYWLDDHVKIILTPPWLGGDENGKFKKDD
jgi:hypothetical protein